MKPCIILVADSTMKQTLKAFLERPDFYDLMGVSRDFAIDTDDDIIQLPGETDGGVWKHAHQLLRPYISTHQYALIMLDAAWEGAPKARLIPTKMGKQLDNNGWKNRHAVVVLDPELEQMLWQDHSVVEDAFRYNRTDQTLREFLGNADLWPDDKPKPPDPKGAVEHLETQGWGIKRTPAYVRIASSVPIPENPDAAFVALRSTLQTWFPAESKGEGQA